MKIFILGTGHMGSWLAAALAPGHEVAAFDTDRDKLEKLSGARRLGGLGELADFGPELAINAVSLKSTREAFDSMLPHLPAGCIISDIASVKAGLREYYARAARPFVSTHPMFGPTFARFDDLAGENAIIISESCDRGKEFFREFYAGLGLNVFEYSFEGHDETTAYSLATPFASTIAFAACMKGQEAPGTTFKKHREIARGLLSEDDYLLAEILFAPGALGQIEKISQQLAYLTHIIKGRDFEVMKKFLRRLRDNLERKPG
jgi:prephenate dehydrogenase